MKTESDWLALSAAWKKSGLSQSVFCQQQGISYAKFCAARSELLQRGVVDCAKPGSDNTKSQVKNHSANNRFVPLFAEPPALKAPQKNDRFPVSQSIEIELPFGILIRIPAHDHSA